MTKAKVFVYAREFDGLPKESDFEIIEEDLPPLNEGEFLAKAVYLTVDPYMRAYAGSFKVGQPLIGQQVAQITESKNPKYPVGSYVVASYGWRTHTVANELQPPKSILNGWAIPELGNVPKSLSLGVLGMPGNTAYFGTLEILQPKAGETLVVSGAAGAVGSIVGQIGKIKGQKVIGIAGSEEKGKWLVNELGFDHFINYKTDDVNKALKEFAPNGIDCYFENVGGEITDAVLNHINKFGRIAICGVSSVYNEKNSRYGLNEIVLLSKQLKVEGLVVTRWNDRWMEGVNQLLKWIQEGKIKYKETITEGFENMPKAFIDMLKGGNTGKAVVKI